MTQETIPARAGGGRGPRGRSRLELRRRLSKPALFNLRLGPLLSIYGWRLRHHGVQELLAAIGIAIGVALMVGVLISSHSITGSARAISRAIIGSARLQVAARSPAGFDEGIVERIGKLPGVRVAAPLLRGDAVIVGPNGSRSIQLVGATASQLALEGSATRYLGSENVRGGLALTSSLAEKVGATAGRYVTILARGTAQRLPVHAVWTTQQVGSLAYSGIAVSTVLTAQRVLSLPRRVTQVLIAPNRGSEAHVLVELDRLAAGRLDVQSAEHELAVLDVSAQPLNQSSKLLAAIGALVGFLFAFNAVLLTVPERRRWVMEARTQGYSAGQVIAVLAFQAVILGVIASALGVVAGYALAKALFSSVPSYLTLSFTIGAHPVVSLPTVTLALGAGILAALVASAPPLRDLLPRRPIDAVLHGTGKLGHSIAPGTALVSSALGGAVVLAAILLAVLAPSVSIAANLLLGIGALCLVPALLVGAIRILMPAAERMRGSMFAIALAEAEGTATRSIALAGVAALAVYGSVALQGARHDLLRGLDAAVVQYLNTADLWVTTTGENFLTDDSFKDAGVAAAIARAPGVASVRSYQASLLDVGDRRMWIRARPANDPTLIQSSQLIRGNLRRATALIRSGGWAAVPNGFASERHLSIGGSFVLPTPAGSLPLRVAAITTNIGWPPGAVTINQSDYQRWWQTTDPTALEVSLRPGVSPSSAKGAVIQALAGREGLRVQSLAEREVRFEQSANQGVHSLGVISTLMLIAAALAIVCALSAVIVARGDDLSARKAEGYQTGQLWRMIVLESAVVLGIGVLDGALLGIGAHALTSRWLRLSQGFPAPFSLGAPQVLITLAILGGSALAVIACVGAVAARVPPRLSLQE